jgi:carboxymethylenebutenolidase
MNGKAIEIKTKDGLASCQFFNPPQEGNRPAVILYMDAFGVRPALCDMAGRLAVNGYYVLLPNLFYRAGPFKPFNAATTINDEPERNRLMALIQSISNEKVTQDTASFLDYLAPFVGGCKIGCVGYCMGGAFALWAAATYPDRIGAVATLHAARLATDQPDSPHLLASKIRAGVYIGIAGIDPHFPPDEKERLESALQFAHVEHTIEIYPNARHGFAVNDTAVYDRAASELHWQRILNLFSKYLPGSGKK